MNSYIELALIMLLLGLIYTGMLGVTAKITRPEMEEPNLQSVDAAEATEVLVHRLVTDIYIGSSQDVFHYMLPRIGNKLIEYLLILLVSDGNRLVLEFQCTDQDGGYVRFPNIAQVVECCHEQGIRTIFIAHNHPHGNVLPSPEDIHYTSQLVDKLQQAGIAVRDHIIVTGRQYYSMRHNDQFGIVFK